MKPLIIAIAGLAFLVTSVHADIYLFPRGETPAMSIIEAIRICEKMALASNIGKFNPTNADLVGGKEAGAGSWVFKQYTKLGEEYVFRIAFSDKTATLLKMRDRSGRMKDDVVLATFRLEGQELVRLPNPPPPPEDPEDPFADETTPERPAGKGGGESTIVPSPCPPIR